MDDINEQVDPQNIWFDTNSITVRRKITFLLSFFGYPIFDFTPFSPFYQPLINVSGHISFQIVLNPYSTLQYLSFEVLHDHICLNLDLTRFRGAPNLRGLEKGVKGVKKIGTQNFYAS